MRIGGSKMIHFYRIDFKEAAAVEESDSRSWFDKIIENTVCRFFGHKRLINFAGLKHNPKHCHRCSRRIVE
jgi:hypothetical protein